MSHRIRTKGFFVNAEVNVPLTFLILRSRKLSLFRITEFFKFNSCDISRIVPLNMQKNHPIIPLSMLTDNLCNQKCF